MVWSRPTSLLPPGALTDIMTGHVLSICSRHKCAPRCTCLSMGTRPQVCHTCYRAGKRLPEGGAKARTFQPAHNCGIFRPISPRARHLSSPSCYLAREVGSSVEHTTGPQATLAPAINIYRQEAAVQLRRSFWGRCGGCCRRGRSCTRRTSSRTRASGTSPRS